MKKLTAIVLVLLALPAARAQTEAGIASGLFSPKRVVKTNLAGYAWLSASLNYEQKTGLKTSVGLLSGYKFPSAIKVEAIGELDGERQTYAGEVEPKGFFVNPYFRFYTKETFNGFYLEAFVRYFDYNFLVPYDYDKNERVISANLDGTASAIGGGLGLGVQFPLAPRVYMDINAGFGVGMGNIHLETNDPNLELVDYQSIKRNIEQYEDRADIQVFLLDDILTDPKAYANDTKAWADFENKMFPMMRGAISIGYAF